MNLAQTRPTIGLVLCAAMLCTAALCLASPAQEAAASAQAVRVDEHLLRQAWASHRLDGDLPHARGLYRQIYDTNTAATSALGDLRARAALGLGILSRDESDADQARLWFQRVLELEGVSARWSRSARELLAELRLEAETSSSQLASELARQVTALETQLEELEAEMELRGETLRQRDDLIRRLKEGLARDAQPSIPQPTEAAQLMETMLQEERDARAVEHYFINTALARSRELYRGGRYLHALNELKKVLEVDPHHRGALDLRFRCNELLATAAGKRELGEEARRYSGVRTRRLVLEAMQADLDRGQRHYRAGELNAAIVALEGVLREYVYCPTPLSDMEIATYVQPAERLLRRCFDESGSGSETIALRGRKGDLRGQLEERFRQFLDQERALEEVRTDVENFKESHPDFGIEYARRMVAETMEAAVTALSQGERRVASVKLGDVKTLLTWFPEVDDEEGTLRKSVEEQLAALNVSDTSEREVAPPGE